MLALTDNPNRDPIMLQKLMALSLLASINLAMAADYDLLIRNGTVYDGTGAPPYVGDVAISGDRVNAIGSLPKHSADIEIDASGLAVAPGFFNMLSHAHLSLLSDGRAMSDVLSNHLGVDANTWKCDLFPPISSPT